MMEWCASIVSIRNICSALQVWEIMSQWISSFLTNDAILKFLILILFLFEVTDKMTTFFFFESWSQVVFLDTSFHIFLMLFWFAITMTKMKNKMKFIKGNCCAVIWDLLLIHQHFWKNMQYRMQTLRLNTTPLCQ